MTIRMRRKQLLGVVALVCLGPACAGTGGGETRESHYLRWVSFDVGFNEHLLLRWHKRKMPLKVHLPRPAEGLFPDAEAIYDSVRDGVEDWTDVVEPGVPSFVFVDTPSEADIPIVWESAPDGDWYIAFCNYAYPLSRSRFGVDRILVTGRWSPDHVADLHEVYETVLHEVGHALGLGGHSPDPGDIMYASVSGEASGLSARDRATLRALYARGMGARMVGPKR